MSVRAERLTRSLTVGAVMLSGVRKGSVVACASLSDTARRYAGHDAPLSGVAYASVTLAQRLRLFLPPTGDGPFPLIICIRCGVGGPAARVSSTSRRRSDNGPAGDGHQRRCAAL